VDGLPLFSDSLAMAPPAELLPHVAGRVAAFEVLLVTIGIAWLLSRAIVRDAERVPRAVLALTILAVGLAAAVWSVVFSADVRAYAAYGIELLHGVNPYAASLTSAAGDPALSEQLTAWSGSIPRDVYGPVFTALCALAALSHAPVSALRLLAIAATAGCVLVWRRDDPRGAATFATHPVILWAAIEGHNDALALLPVLLGLGALGRSRIVWFATAALTKAFALLPLIDALVPRRLRLGRALHAPAVLGLWALLPHREAW
jgi:hypothetical protein